MRARLRHVVAVVLPALFLAPGLPAAAWDRLGPVRELGAGITPAIAIGPDGTIHVVSMQAGAIEHRRAAPGGEFGPAIPVPVPEGPGDYSSPHLVGDAQGNLHLTFSRGVTSASKKAWYAVCRDGRWSEPVLAIDHSIDERRANYPRLAVDPAGTTAYLGAFAGGKIGSTLVRLEDLAGTPRVSARFDTPLWAAHPFLDSSGDVLVVGRAGSRGHQLQRHSRDLHPEGEPLLLSVGTPWKTFEATAGLIDAQGIVHAVGLTRSGEKNILWYNTSARAAAGKPVVLGPEVGPEASERVYPVMVRDARGRIYVSFRDHATGEAKLTIVEPDAGRFGEPVVIAPAITSRLRWNAHLAAAPDGGVWLAWDVGGRSYFRAVGMTGFLNRRAQRAQR